MSNLFPTPLEACMKEQGIPKEEWDKLPFGEDVHRLTTVQDILDATTPENMDGFLDDLRMVLVGSYAARMECPGMKLDHIDWTDDGERVVACDMPDGSVLGISHKEGGVDNWTPVSEAMPGDDISVSAMWHLGLEVIRVSPAATWQGKWYVLNYNGEKIEGAIVTHWQYLPRPIKKGGTRRNRDNQ